MKLEGFTDADWAGSTANRKSTSGCSFSLGSGAISWYSRKQKSVALSSAEAEYMAASMATCEAFWLQKLLAGLFNQELSTLCFKISRILLSLLFFLLFLGLKWGTSSSGF